jgi:hypothetical protein
MMSGYTWELGSTGGRGVLPSARHTLTETSPAATEDIPRNIASNISLFIIYAPVKRILLSKPAVHKIGLWLFVKVKNA